MEEYVEGARNLIRTLELDSKGALIVICDEENKDFSDYIFLGAKNENIDEILYVVIPKIYRPLNKVPVPLYKAIEKSKGLIHITKRIPEENFLFNRPLKAFCNQNKCRYIYIYDPKVEYLKEGILANYQAVEKKAKNVQNILERSEKITVTSDLGTNISFKIYKHRIVPRSPIFLEDMYENQAPEGEVMSCPIEETFNGVIFVDGVSTGLGIPPSPIKWEFQNGLVSNVMGNKKYLENMLNLLRKSDPRLNSLIGIDIAEFSVGVNDWAKFDDNISNCEKVSGGIHFGFGQVKGGIGIYRGGTFHFDNILLNPSVNVIFPNKKEFKLIDKGKLNTDVS